MGSPNEYENQGAPSTAETTRDMKSECQKSSKESTQDQVHIKQLQGSISKLQSQITEVQWALDNVLATSREYEQRTTPKMSTKADTESHTTSTTAVIPTPASQGEQISDQQIIESARVAVSGRIKMLTRYNDIRDAAMSLCEVVAAHKGMRVGEVLREHGAEVGD